MKHRVHGPANSRTRHTTTPPAPTDLADTPAGRPGRSLAGVAASAALTLLCIALPTAALMCIGYRLGGLPTMWGTFIGAFFPLTRTIEAWRARKRR